MTDCKSGVDLRMHFQVFFPYFRMYDFTFSIEFENNPKKKIFPFSSSQWRMWDRKKNQPITYINVSFILVRGFNRQGTLVAWRFRARFAWVGIHLGKSRKTPRLCNPRSPDETWRLNVLVRSQQQGFSTDFPSILNTLSWNCDTFGHTHSRVQGVLLWSKATTERKFTSL